MARRQTYKAARKSFRSASERYHWIYFLCLALPFFAGLGDSSIWDSNEAYYVQTPREMIQRDSWVVPYFNGQPRLNKPPLAYWVVAVFYGLFEASLLWQRIPMALLALGSVLLLYRIGRELFQAPQVALLAAGILAVTFRYLMLARRLLIDILLVFCLLAAVALFLRWLRGGGPIPFLLTALFAGLAFLAKGPVALVILAILLGYLWLSGQAGQLRHAPWRAALLILLAVSSSWFLLLGLEMGWKPVGDFFWTENWGRFFDLDFGPRRGALFYLGVFMGDFFPWSIFFVAALFSGVKSRRVGGRRGQSPLQFLSLWMGVLLLLLVLSHNKQEHYLLPLYPAAALWTAAYLQGRRVPLVLLGLASLGLLAAALLLASGVVALFPADPLLWAPFLLLAPLGFSLWRQRWKRVTASLALFYAAAFALYSRPLEEYRPVTHLVAALQRDAGSETFLAGYWGYAAPSLTYYLDRPILELREAGEALAELEGPHRTYLLLSQQAYEEASRRLSRPLRIVQVRDRLYTKSRVFIEGIRRGRIDLLREGWAQPIYLVTNADRAGHDLPVRGYPGLERSGQSPASVRSTQESAGLAGEVLRGSLRR